ncbi:hypothetical protein SAMN05443287_10883 [Micromonospora phaseoli]|uniref:Uncharacterized protein n=1 Tax=Micromonospora phaseoli TaxID=1144548 RepID=A0A1H7C5X5_9ACTN|nr:hypothetical protein [Micromonospora phaseoli]PZV92778.1 hypothetical protein CLV64_110201 [Micromonospora phaseoli]GIJ76565.1 hypothetical protein Xph01_09970 [Micromonospora phaseoli]SEJ82020.1 hypothetical protein SAMN05443287_10883 [Micromonospora phaseoli]
MLSIRLYDIATGHVQTLTEVVDLASADRWLTQFAAGGIGTNDVVYVVESAPQPAPADRPEASCPVAA